MVISLEIGHKLWKTAAKLVNQENQSIVPKCPKMHQNEYRFSKNFRGWHPRTPVLGRDPGGECVHLPRGDRRPWLNWTVELSCKSLHTGKLNWTQLNKTGQSSSVELSWVFRCEGAYNSTQLAYDWVGVSRGKLNMFRKFQLSWVASSDVKALTTQLNSTRLVFGISEHLSDSVQLSWVEL